MCWSFTVEYFTDMADTQNLMSTEKSENMTCVSV